MAIHESGEDYLEAIYCLSKEQTDVHSVEVARRIGVSKPTVTKAIKILVSDGFVSMDGVHLRLTEQGVRRAEEVFEKHTVITKYWVMQGVPLEVAEKDACRMEHIVSGETFAVMKAFVNNTKQERE